MDELVEDLFDGGHKRTERTAMTWPMSGRAYTVLADAGIDEAEAAEIIRANNGTTLPSGAVLLGDSQRRVVLVPPGVALASTTKEAIGWKDLAVPAAGLALMAPFAAPAQAAGGWGQVGAPAQEQQAPQPVAPQQEMSQQLMEQIVAYYSQKPGVSVTVQDLGGKDGTTGLAGSNTVFISPSIKTQLDSFAQNTRNPGNNGLGTNGLAVLIHEALHTRGPYGGGEQNERVAPGSFFEWGDEWQAHQMACNLVPDAVQRFFNILPGTKLYQAYWNSAKSLGYNRNWGAPIPGLNGQEIFGDRTQTMGGPGG